MTTWWKKRSKKVKLMSMMTRAHEIHQTQLDQSLELIQISLNGLMETADAKTEADIAYHDWFLSQYALAKQDLEHMAIRIIGNTQSSVEDDLRAIVEKETAINHMMEDSDTEPSLDIQQLMQKVKPNIMQKI